MSGEVDDVLEAGGWRVSGLATSGSAALLTGSGEANEVLTVDGWDVGDTGSGTIGQARITAANLYRVTSESEDGDYVAQLQTSDGQPLVNPQVTGGNGAFAIGDVPAEFYTVNGQIATSGGNLLYNSAAGAIKGIVVADASLLPDPIAPVSISISANGYSSLTVEVPIA